MIELVIDNREKFLINIFEKNNVNILKENLDIGDIIIKYKSSPIIIIERKTLDDLSTSIKDGRYKEQKYRLINSIDKSKKKIYLIEGFDIKNNFKLSEQTFRSCIINTILRDNINIIQTKSIDDTYNYLIKIIDQLPKYIDSLYESINNINKLECETLNENNSYVDNCKSVKKNNFNKEMFEIQQLSLIPGISTKLSKTIIDNFGSMKDIYLYENKEKLLIEISNIKYGKSEKKIGKKIAEKIVSIL